jgi:hypothetical protein
MSKKFAAPWRLVRARQKGDSDVKRLHLAGKRKKCIVIADTLEG